MNPLFFDGSNVKVYKPYNSNLRGNYVNALIENKDGQMWLGTNQGLSFYDQKRDEFVYFEGPVKGKDYGASPYYVDEKGQVWVTIALNDKTDLYTFSPETKTYNLIINNVPKKLGEINQKPNQAIKHVYYTFGEGIVKATISAYKVKKTEHFLKLKEQKLKRF